MPLGNLTGAMNVGHYPVVYLVDSDVLPRQIFDKARQNGTMASLEPGVKLDPDDPADYRSKVERDRRLFGNCVVEVDPLDLKPVTVTTPVKAR